MTVAEAISEVTQQRNEMTADTAYSYMKKVHRWLCDNYLLSTKLFYIQLTAGVYSYQLDTSIRRTRTSTFIPSANGYYPLVAESIVDWDILYPSWRNTSASQPSAYSIDEGYINLRYAPSVSSVGTGANMYPRIDLWGSVLPSFTKTDSLPPDVPEDLYIDWTILKWCEKSAQPLVQIYQPQVLEQLDSLKLNLQKKAHNYRPRQTPSAMYQSSV